MSGHQLSHLAPGEMPLDQPDPDVRCAALRCTAGHSRSAEDLRRLCEVLGLDPEVDRCAERVDNTG